jgi:hypothetical protein
MTKKGFSKDLRHSTFVILWSFVIGYSSFLDHWSLVILFSLTAAGQPR